MDAPYAARSKNLNSRDTSEHERRRDGGSAVYALRRRRAEIATGNLPHPVATQKAFQVLTFEAEHWTASGDRGDGRHRSASLYGGDHSVSRVAVRRNRESLG